MSVEEIQAKIDILQKKLDDMGWAAMASKVDRRGRIVVPHMMDETLSVRKKRRRQYLKDTAGLRAEIQALRDQLPKKSAASAKGFML